MSKPPYWIQHTLKQSGKKILAFVTEALGLAPSQISLGKLHGCGHFGCVFEILTPTGPSPWVVKLSRDPTEGPIWQAISDNRYGDGIARLKAIGRVRPDIRYRRGVWPVFVIVREDVTPLSAVPTKDAYEYREQWRFVTALHELKDWLRRNKRAVGSDDSAADLIMRISDSEPGSIIGPTMFDMASDGILLRDVHANNVGYRRRANLDGHWRQDEYPIIFDPGHSPVGEQTISELPDA